MSQKPIPACVSIQEVAEPGKFGWLFCRLYVPRDVQITHITRPLSSIFQYHSLLVSNKDTHR